MSYEKNINAGIVPDNNTDKKSPNQPLPEPPALEDEELGM